ncbi:MAG: GGDEF domain-containing protein [Wenzhouxiangella sp.]|nr:GGDEF domain-containing protein [Wenzhouxiangella sp.]MCH8476451.1 GGDEF domain-containing protein [Wenzhouxiangella sp.]TVR95154.1 MAG: GGDEF domain-containing protein [Wenzhouxiangellaceae bacterium]
MAEQIEMGLELIDARTLALLSGLGGLVLGMAIMLIWTLARGSRTKGDSAVGRDPLTGLRNRMSLDDHARRELDFAQRYQASLSVLAIDIDHFARINSRYGFAAGDLLLKAVSDELTDELRSTDFVFRIGGEEFLVLLPFAALKDGALVAERLRERISRQRFASPSAQPIEVTISIGVAEVRMAEENWDEAVLRADQALSEAKSAGRDRVFAASMDEWKRPFAMGLDRLLESETPQPALLRCVNG